MWSERSAKLSDVRLPTPERSVAPKRPGEELPDSVQLRARIDTPGDDNGMGSPQYAPTSPASDVTPRNLEDVMGLSSVERSILASALLNVDIIEVFSPKRVSKLAANFCLIAGSSLNLTKG